MRYNPAMLPDLKVNDIIRMRKPHPCGSYTWNVTRLGADIRMECCQCGHKVMLARRELSRKMKAILAQDELSQNKS
jgi:hypothetical protein